MGGNYSSDEERKRRKKKRRSRSRSSDSDVSTRSSTNKKLKRKRRSRSRSRSRREAGSRSSKPSSVRSRSGSRDRRRRRSTSRDRRRSSSRDRKRPSRSHRSSRSKSPARRSQHSKRSRSRERKKRSSSSRSPTPAKDRVEAFGKPLPPKPRAESSDDEETKLAKEKAKKKTPYAVFDLRRTDEEETRAKRIADIDDDSFQQSSFKSSRGDKQGDGKTAPSSSSHDDAIFGSKNIKTETKPDISSSSSDGAVKKEEVRPLSIIEKVFDVKLPDNMIGVDLKGLLAHPSLYEDPKVKDARWKKKWLEMRRKKMEKMKSEGLTAVGGISLF